MRQPEKQVRIAVTVQPGAHRSEIVECTGDVWRIKIAAPADKGKANKELVNFLSKTLEIGKDGISVDRGLTSHYKLVTISNLSQEEVTRKLTAARITKRKP
jgi:uncharacterized protein